MTGYVLEHTSKKGQKPNRRSQTKHAHAKTKAIWIRKNDLRGYVVHTALKAHNSNCGI